MPTQLLVQALTRLPQLSKVCDRVYMMSLLMR